MNYYFYNYKYFILLLITIWLVGCDKDDELSRDKAKIILSQTETFTSQHKSVKFNDTGYAKTVEQGLWSGQYDLLVAGILGVNAEELSVQPYKIRLQEVTGITDNPSGEGKIKSVEFIWERYGLPEVAKRYVNQGGNGKSTLRLYDDGWRIVQLELGYANKPFILSKQELEAETKDIESERERIRVVNEALRLEKQKFSEDVSKAKKPSNEIGKYKYVGFENYQPARIPGSITLTDVDFTLSYPRPSSPGKVQVFSFFDAFEPARQDYQHDAETTGGKYVAWGSIRSQWGRILIKDRSARVPYGWGEAYGLDVRPFTSSGYNTPLIFSDIKERDRFVRDLSISLTAWMNKNEKLIKKPKQIEIDID